MVLILAILITVAMAAFVAFPLLAGDTSGDTLQVDVTPLADLKRRRLVVYDNLQDLEFEFKSGKIAEKDYASLKQNYLGEAASLMAASKELQREDREDQVIEKEIAARRERRRVPKVEEYVCSACGFENPLPVKFCGECGAKITPKTK
jgi:hypothetical protein